MSNAESSAAETADKTAGGVPSNAGEHQDNQQDGGAKGGNQQDGGQQDGGQEEGDQQRINFLLVWFLGIALLGLVFAIVYLSIANEKLTLPNGLTSLASLIGGGLLALLNPVHGTRTGSQKGKGSGPKAG